MMKLWELLCVSFWLCVVCSSDKELDASGRNVCQSDRIRGTYVCCQGWKQEGRECSTPICDGLDACKEDEVCVRPAICRCKPGFYGANCKSRCPDKYWGPDCKENCLCHPNGRCDPLTGECQCHSKHWGPLCKFQCSCGSHGHCDPLTGSCQCESGWWSANCKKQCQCNLSSSRCDPATGLCVCKQGWWGHRCSVKCNCNSSSCGQYSGRCECQDGWWGPKCEHSCDCLHGKCNPVSGHCDCDSGYEGQNCQELCAAGFYGPKCKFNCGHCQGGQPCSPVDGSCMRCALGWNGTRCDQKCSSGYYGKDCQEPCPRCRHGEACLPESGHCLSCDPGRLGPRCDTPCPPGKFGDQCLSTCLDCVHGSCDHVTGACVCAPGYWRTSCNDTCPEGVFGLNCTSPCSCPESWCHPVSGACKGGWEQQGALIAGILIPALGLLLCITCCCCCGTHPVDTKDRENSGPLSRAKHHVQGVLANLSSALPCIPLDSSKLSWVTVSHHDTEIPFNHSFIESPSTGCASQNSFSSFDTDEEGPVYCVPPREDNSSAAVDELDEINLQNIVPDVSVFNSEDVSQPFPIPRTSSIAKVKRPSVSFAEGTKFGPECRTDSTTETPILARKSKIPWSLAKLSSFSSYSPAGGEEPQQSGEIHEANEKAEPTKEGEDYKVSSRTPIRSHRWTMINIPKATQKNEIDDFSKTNSEMKRKRKSITTVYESIGPAGTLSSTSKISEEYRHRLVPPVVTCLGGFQRVKQKNKKENRLRINVQGTPTVPKEKKSRVILNSLSKIPCQEDSERTLKSPQEPCDSSVARNQDYAAKKPPIPSSFILKKMVSKADNGTKMIGTSHCENQETMKMCSQLKDLETCEQNVTEEEETEPKYENVSNHNTPFLHSQ
ncbi:scavenger receptor class F member 1 isoform X1 [Microcaecilia unicolor]|uniref:Scavenger receptor class F member 1 isoform X1 n=1 Tax=Microcaecilia unicolor TaxID=1415580 RepID=A0A6P8A161_9AMPH|nr:scavenger receptor class F member 1 isoform X1 [Microcaecilia unicolor]